MSPEQSQALVDFLLAMADDEMILSHRDSEWTGHGPILEEDIAFSNIAQDEMGHARLWYGLLESLTGKTPDHLVFFRQPSGFRNIQMVELPNGDWGFSMLRQYLFDTAEMYRLSHLIHSSYQPLAGVAAKIRQEEIYHVRHTHHWIKRLGLGTTESNRRMQKALNTLWGYAHQLFAPLPNEDQLVTEGIMTESETLHQQWKESVVSHLQDSGLQIPEDNNPTTMDRARHTKHLAVLLDELQMVARLYPEAEW